MWKLFLGGGVILGGVLVALVCKMNLVIEGKPDAQGNTHWIIASGSASPKTPADGPSESRPSSPASDNSQPVSHEKPASQIDGSKATSAEPKKTSPTPEPTPVTKSEKSDAGDAVSEIRKVGEQMVKVVKELNADTLKKLVTLETQLRKLEEELARGQGELANVTAKLEEMRKELNVMSQKLAKEENKSSDLEATIKALTEKIKALENGKKSPQTTGSTDSNPGTGTPPPPPPTVANSTDRSWRTCDGVQHAVKAGVDTTVYCTTCQRSTIVNVK